MSTVTRINQCITPSFEHGSVGGWVAGGSPAPTLSVSTDVGSAITGNTHSLKVVWAGNSFLPNAQIPCTLTPGQTYVISASVYVPAGNPVVGFLIGSMGLAGFGPQSSLTGQWQRLTWVVTIAAGAGQAFSIYATGSVTSGQKCYVDEIMIEETSVPGSYGDGDQPGWLWLGVAGQAMSIQQASGGTSGVAVSTSPTNTLRYSMFDVNTNSFITTLQCRGMTFGSRLNDAGPCNFNLALADPSQLLQHQAFLSYAGVSPVKLVIDQGGIIVWAGLLWTTDYDSDTSTMPVNGKEMLSYFDARVIAKDYSQSTYPNGIDPAQLPYKAITDAQAVANGSIGFVIQGGTSTIPHIIPGYQVTQNPTVAQVIADATIGVAPGTGGIDVNVSNTYVGGAPQHTVVIATPRAGRAAGQTGLVLDLSSAVKFTWPIDASITGNQVVAFGAGTGSIQPKAVVNAEGIPLGGLGQAPLLQQVLNFMNVQSQQQLNMMAQGAAVMYGQPVATPVVTVPIDYPSCQLGSFAIGDDVRVMCPKGHPRFPQGLDQFWRIVAWTVTVPDEGVTTVALTLNVPPVF